MSFAVAGAIVGSAVIGGIASNKAAKKQAGAAEQAGRLSQAQYDQSRSDLAPYRQTGTLANTRLQELLGLSQAPGSAIPPQTYQAGQSGDPVWEKVLSDFNARHRARFGVDMNRPWDADADAQTAYNGLVSRYRALKGSEPAQEPSGDFGYLTRPFTGDDLENEPGYQFGLSEGEKSINRAALGRGSFDSGATLKALLRYGNDYAGTKFNEGFNRNMSTKQSIYQMLSGQSGQGANAAGMTAGLGANAAGMQGNFLTQGADARAAGLIGGVNQLNAGVGNYLDYKNNQAFADYMKTLRAGSMNSGASSSFASNPFQQYVPRS